MLGRFSANSSATSHFGSTARALDGHTGSVPLPIEFIQPLTTTLTATSPQARGLKQSAIAMDVIEPKPFEAKIVPHVTKFENLLQEGQALLAALRARGLVKGAGSRIEMYVRVLDEALHFQTHRRLRKGFLGLHHAAYELMQLLMIWSAFRSDVVLPRRFEAIVSGEYAAFQNSREDDPGRAAQFELYLAAVLRKGGLVVAVDTEPDIIANVNGMRIAIAAKRPQSMSAVRKALKGAARQIRGVGLPGFIALDLTVATVDRPVALASVAHADEVVRVGISVLTRAIRSLHPTLKRFFETTKDPAPLGIIYHWDLPTEVRSTGQIANSARWEVHGPVPGESLARALVSANVHSG